jgi:hypothetical protein
MCSDVLELENMMRLIGGMIQKRITIALLTAMIAMVIAPAGITANAQVPTVASFTDLTFSLSSDGPAMTYFPVGTKQIFARWNYTGIPSQTRVVRTWYRDGRLFTQKEDPWAWGTDGRLTHISIFDFSEGLTPGYYSVIIALIPTIPGAQVSGDFVIAAAPPTVVPPSNSPSFSNLTASTSAGGPVVTVFPARTPIVSVRWDFANIPIGAVMQRDWYFNGVRFRSLQEPWSAYWGTSGRLTHIAIYDYEFGLASGNYQVIIFLRDNPSVEVSTKFTILAAGSPSTGQPSFSNLTFSTSGNGLATAIFPRGIQRIYARWDFNNISPESRVRRRWYRNGALWIEREEAWAYSASGTSRDISIYDLQNGLLPGDYYVEMSLVGNPNVFVSGYFTIA